MTASIVRLLRLTSTRCGCCEPAESPGAVSDTFVVSDEEAAAFIAHHPVTGLSCGSCVSTLTTAVEGLPRVDSVPIDVVGGGAHTMTAGGATSREELRQVTQHAGYTMVTSSPENPSIIERKESHEYPTSSR